MTEWSLSRTDRIRKFKSALMIALVYVAAIGASLPFFSICWYVFKQGVPALDWNFLVSLPKPPGETGGGMANAILGTLTMVGMASLVGLPWGILTGVYLSEYGRGYTASFLRAAIDLLTSVPSIVVGIFSYSLIVAHFGFSAYAGAFALLVIILPFVARATEEILKLLPRTYREAGLALGLPRWRVILQIVIPGCRMGLITACMLAIARVAGETAPLLFTALGNQFYSQSLNQPTASLPVQIYNFAKSGFVDLERQAWGGALVLVLFVVLTNLLVRLALARKEGQR